MVALYPRTRTNIYKKRSSYVTQLGCYFPCPCACSGRLGLWWHCSRFCGNSTNIIHIIHRIIYCCSDTTFDVDVLPCGTIHTCVLSCQNLIATPSHRSLISFTDDAINVVNSLVEKLPCDLPTNVHKEDLPLTIKQSGSYCIAEELAGTSPYQSPSKHRMLNLI